MTTPSQFRRLAAVLGCLGIFVFVLTHSSLGKSAPREKHRHHPMVTKNEAIEDLGKIEHIVFLVKENRTFDNLFGTFPGADGATSGTISTGEVIPLGRTPDRTLRDISHSFQSAVTAIDSGAMDQFDLIPGGNVDGDFLAYTQHTQEDIPNYFTYARNFVLAVSGGEKSRKSDGSAGSGRMR